MSMRFPVALRTRPTQSVLLMLIVALVYRFVVDVYFIRIGGAMTHHWTTNEMASVARSLVLQHAFAGAYSGYSGPTAWLAPVYPSLVAAVFSLFGVDTKASAVIVLLLNATASALTAGVIYKLGCEYLTKRVGLVAGWAWALSPLSVLMPLLLWETSLSALTLSLGLLLLLRASSLRQWTVAGALWGASALVNPSLLAPLPVILVSRLWKVPRRISAGIAFCLTLSCVVFPWTIRNRLELHAFFPVRSNGWAEVYFGNVDFRLHPYGHTTGLYQQLGEARFVERLKREAIQYIVEHPAQFAWVSLNRAVRFWFVPLNFLPLTLIATCGCWAGAVLLLRKSHPFAIPFASVLIFYPMIFSVTHIEARYRHPIEPVIYLLAAYAGCEVYDRRKEWKQSRDRASG